MNHTEMPPYGNRLTAENIGRCVRAQRKAQGATQSDLAALYGVGIRFISELENGKPTWNWARSCRCSSAWGSRSARGPVAGNLNL